MTGRFISLEGGEGVGKSTQARRLADALAAQGIDAIVTREPGGSPNAEAIRDLVLQGEGGRWTMRAEALLFAAARSDHVDRLIRPALQSGQWVICDRFIDSSRAYQGAAGGLGDDAVLALHQVGSGGLMPDRTLVLALPGGDAMARAEARDAGETDRIGARGADYHAGVAQAFAHMAQAEPERMRIVDASGTADDVTRRLADAVADLLP